MLARVYRSIFSRGARSFCSLNRKSQVLFRRGREEDEVYAREVRAVRAGIEAYKTSCENGGSRARLRRNIHRLEKGLLMRPRRDLFAIDYIDETLSELEQSMHDPGQPELEKRWAADVLREYFAATRADPATRAARERFKGMDDDSSSTGGEVPYIRDATLAERVRYEDLLALARHRRSVRWFLPKNVPRELVVKAMEAALEAPSACNRQPFIFRAFDSPDRVREIARIPMGTVGYGHQIPMLIVVVGQMRNFHDPRDRHLIYIDGALAAMSFTLALETLGLSSCVINWPDIEEREQRMREALDLAEDERPVFLLAVGYADPEALVARSAKREVREILQFEG